MSVFMTKPVPVLQQLQELLQIGSFTLVIAPFVSGNPAFASSHPQEKSAMSTD